MRVDWNEELRRAYDQGYWDARREFEHHLMTRHQHGQQQGAGQSFQGERSGGFRGDVGQGGWEGDRSHGQSQYGRSVYGPEQSGGRGEWRSEMGGRGGMGQGSMSQGSMGQSGMGQNGMGQGSMGRGHGDRGDAGYRDYPPGDRRSAFEGRGMGREDWRDDHSRHDHSQHDRSRYDRGESRGEQQGFFDRVGQEVRSWFGDDERGRDDRGWRDSDR